MKNEKLERFIKVLADEGHITSASWEKYYREHYKNVVELPNGKFIGIEKETIQKDFCFGYRLSHTDTEEYDNANEMADYAKKSESYFTEKNLERINTKIEYLEKHLNEAYIHPMYYRNQDTNLIGYSFDMYHGSARQDGSIQMTEEIRELILAGLRQEKEDFTKRVATYLKRYGTSKVHSWSYWQDA